MVMMLLAHLIQQLRTVCRHIGEPGCQIHSGLEGHGLHEFQCLLVGHDGQLLWGRSSHDAGDQIQLVHMILQEHEMWAQNGATTKTGMTNTLPGNRGFRDTNSANMQPTDHISMDLV
jgi:hypothetical protein